MTRYEFISINIWGHELRGEPYHSYTQIDPAIKTDILMYCEYMNKVGGIGTFLYNTIQHLKKDYDRADGRCQVDTSLTDYS